MKKYIDKDGIPIHVPKFEPAVTFDTKNHVIIDYDWEGLYKLSREKQIDRLEFILRSLKELPETLQMAKRSSPLQRDAGLKSGKQGGINEKNND